MAGENGHLTEQLCSTQPEAAPSLHLIKPACSLEAGRTSSAPASMLRRVRSTKKPQIMKNCSPRNSVTQPRCHRLLQGFSIITHRLHRWWQPGSHWRQSDQTPARLCLGRLPAAHTTHRQPYFTGAKSTQRMLMTLHVEKAPASKPMTGPPAATTGIEDYPASQEGITSTMLKEILQSLHSI